MVGTGTAANPDNTVSGAVEAIATPPNNADVVYVATVNGGVWKTTNATAKGPSWTPLTDNQITLSGGDIKFAPTDPTFQTLYVGTGSFSSDGNDGTPGRGLLKTTDGGATWTNINPGGIFSGSYIKSVVPTTLGGGNVLLVGAAFSSGGIYRSTNGGTSFVRLSGNGSSGLPNQGASILVADPSNPSVFYAGVPRFGVYRSDDGGVTWTAKNTGIVSPTVSNTRIEIAASPAQPGVVFAAVLNNGTPTGFYRSTNSGNSWTPMDLAGTNENGKFVGTNPGANDDGEEVPGGQGIVHFALLADRTNPNVVYVSGDRQPDNLPSSSGAQDYSGRVFRGDASLPAGQQWQPITNNFANPDNVLGGTSPHADSRDMVFDANGNILQGNDGGIYRLTNPGGTSTTRRWDSVIGNLRNTEFISSAYSSLSHTSFGGAQDTGTHIQVSTNPSAPWEELLEGDGGVVGVDDTSTPGVSIRYTSFQFFGFFNRSYWDANNNFLDDQEVKLIVNGTGGKTLFDVDPNIQFYQPFKLNAVDPTRMVIGTDTLYTSANQGDNLDKLITTGNVFSLAYGGRYRGVANPDILYAGSYDYNTGTPHLFVRATATSGFTDVEANYQAAGGFVAEDLILDPQNDRRAFAVDFDGGVFATFNAGQTWVDVTGNLAALAPGFTPDIRSVAFIGNSADYDTAILAVGGYGGVYSVHSPGLAGTTPTWSRLSTGLSNALVDTLQYNLADDVLLAGTLGRGDWTLKNPAGSASPGPDTSPEFDPSGPSPDEGTTLPRTPFPDFNAPKVAPSGFRGGLSSVPLPSTIDLGASPDSGIDPGSSVVIPLITTGPATSDDATSMPSTEPVPVLVGLFAARRKRDTLSPASSSNG